MSDEPVNQTPPAEDARTQALSEALRSSFFIVKIIMVLLVLAFLSSGFFVVGSQEKAVILRLGRPVGQGEEALLNPGAHWALPPPIDEIERIPFTTVQQAESSVGWYLTPAEIAAGATPPMGLNSLDPAATSYALSADTNIVHVRAVLRYHIVDAIKFHFNFSNPQVFVTNILNNALLYTSSQFLIDDILTRKRLAFREAVLARVDELIRQEDLGIQSDHLDIDASAPLYLVPKFNEVDIAVQKRNTALAQAESYETTTLAAARGSAATRINVEESARTRLVQMTSALAKELTVERAEYERDPAFYKEVRQMKALEQIYTNAQDKIIEPHQNRRELRLNLGREPIGTSTNSVAP